MSHTFYFLCEFHIDGQRLYVVDICSDNDGVLRTSDGNIAASAAEGRMRAFCDANSIPLGAEPPNMYDFDKIAAWCSRPAAEAIDPASFLNAWNMFDDALSVSAGVSGLYEEISHRAEANGIYHKLFWANNLPAVTPPGEHYVAEWSPAEVETLARIFRLGLAELRAGIQGIEQLDWIS